jgi:hypothetical protein
MFVLVRVDPSKIAGIVLSPNAKARAENLCRALRSPPICVIVTVTVSLLAKPKTAGELGGLVWAPTRQPSESALRFYERPVFWAAGSGLGFAILQWIFW